MDHDEILVVDADKETRERLQETLNSANYLTDCVKTAAAALDYLVARPDCRLVLSEIELPQTCGLTLLDTISRDHPEVSVILLTSQRYADLTASVFRRGAIDLLLKPLHRKDLFRAVDRAVEHSRLRRQTLIYRQNLEDLIATRTAKLRATMTDLERSYDITLEAMGDALDLRDEETEGHSKRVTAYTIALARAMHLSPNELKIIARGAFLHDLGKIAIPDSILLKPARLTPEETEIMRTHCDRGYAMVRKIPFLEEAADIVFCHQESFDGSGYPRGLVGEEIPLGARIFAIADTLDAITSDRPYRKGKSFSQAIDEIARCRGTQFDPEIVDAFLAMPSETWPMIRAEVGRHSHAGELVRAAAA